MSNTQAKIDEICEYRGLPSIRKGWPCSVAGRTGRVWGGNSSAKLNVKFDDDGTIRNCHPYWKMKIYDSSGVLVYEHAKTCENWQSAHGLRKQGSDTGDAARCNCAARIRAR